MILILGGGGKGKKKRKGEKKIKNDTSIGGNGKKK